LIALLQAGHQSLSGFANRLKFAMAVAIPRAVMAATVGFFVLGAILLIGLGLAFGFVRLTGAARLDDRW
jgi:hypothetical protein